MDYLKNDIQLFKKKLSSAHYLIKKAQWLYKKIDELYEYVDGIQAISYEKESESNHDPYRPPLSVRLSWYEEEYQSEISAIMYQLDEVDQILMKLDEQLRDMLVLVYVCRISGETVAQWYNYSRPSLFRLMDQGLYDYFAKQGHNFVGIRP